MIHFIAFLMGVVKQISENIDMLIAQIWGEKIYQEVQYRINHANSAYDQARS